MDQIQDQTDDNSHLTAPPVLPKAQKKVMAKALTQAGYSTREIEKLFSIDNVSAWRASKEATPKELERFETNFKEILTSAKRNELSNVFKRIHKLIPRYKRLDHLLKAAEYFEGVRPGQTNITTGGGNVVAILGGASFGPVKPEEKAVDGKTVKDPLPTESVPDTKPDVE